MARRAARNGFDADALGATWTVTCPAGVSPCPVPSGDRFQPMVEGEYTVTYDKITAVGSDRCVFPLYVGGRGLRIELDWEHDLGGTGVDLDLHVHEPGTTDVWVADGGGPHECAWDNCTADDFSFPFGNTPDWFTGVAPPDPVDWYLDPIFEENTCYFTPLAGLTWQALGQGCHNPRLDADNIRCDPLVTDPTSVDFCASENINIDFPPLGQWTRIAVHYYSAQGQTYDVHPRIRVFCDGAQAAELGPRGYYDPEFPITFTGYDADRFWIAADVAMVDDGCGGRYCVVQPVYDDPLFRTPYYTTSPAAQTSFGPAYPPAP